MEWFAQYESIRSRRISGAHTQTGLPDNARLTMTKFFPLLRVT